MVGCEWVTEVKGVLCDKYIEGWKVVRVVDKVGVYGRGRIKG